MLFSKKTRGKVLGIDIGTTSIKLIELSKSGRSLVVDSYGYEPLQYGAIVDQKIKDIESVASSLQNAVRNAGSKSKRGAICVTSNNVISKTISVQAGLKPNELDSLVEMEADRIIPYALDEVNLDYTQLGRRSGATEEEDVQIVVCKKSVVEDLVGVLEIAGIAPAIVEVDIFTLSRIHSVLNHALGSADGNRTDALIDFGFARSQFMVFHNNEMIYNRETPFGGRTLVDSICQTYNLTADKAMIVLRENDLPDGFKSDVLRPFVKTLVQEVLRSLQFFYSSSTHNGIDKLMITGGCAQIGNIEKVVQKHIEVSTEILNPFQLTKFGPKVDKHQFRKDIPSLAMACGLALRGMI